MKYSDIENVAVDNVVVTTVTDGKTETTVAYAKINNYDKIVGYGTAKCMGEDKFDLAVGENLAIGRALRELGKQLERSAYSHVHYRDEVRKIQQEASDRNVQRKKENSYRFECEFAALINAELAEKKPLEENDTIPDGKWWLKHNPKATTVSRVDPPVLYAPLGATTPRWA